MINALPKLIQKNQGKTFNLSFLLLKEIQLKQLIQSNNNQKSNSVSLTLKYFFARKNSFLNKETTQQNNFKQSITQKDNSNEKVPYRKQTQFYTFVDLDKDVDEYQKYLNLFNTHTKKAHEKLVKNELKIIESIIEQKREDLLTKFLLNNTRNRLANGQTIKAISKYYVNKLTVKRQQANTMFSQILESSQKLQILFQTMTIINEYHEFQLFKIFIELFNQKFVLNPVSTHQHNYLLKALELLPSRQCQFLFIYNWLIKQKELPIYFMESQWFGIHTENLKFNNLGQTFYDVRKFVRRYFAFYNKTIINAQIKANQVQNSESPQLQRQNYEHSKRSVIEKDIDCFLKVLNYPTIKRQIQIDGFIVDYVIKGAKQNKKSDSSIDVPVILQVLGSYHYTSSGKLKMKDIRKFILLGSIYRQRKYNIKLLHYQTYNKTWGHRNRLEFIRNLIQGKNTSINWSPQSDGFNSQWQLKETYEEFK